MTFIIEQDETSWLYQVYGPDDEAPAILGGYTSRREAIVATNLEYPELTHVEQGRFCKRWFIVEPVDGFYLEGVSFATRDELEGWLSKQMEVAA